MKKLSFKSKSTNQFIADRNYESIAYNNSKYNFKEVFIVLKFIDKDGITVGSENVSIPAMNKGEKYKVSFYSTHKFKKVKVVIDSFEVK